MAERCCMGRDSSCVVNGLQQSTGKFVDEPCYCDEGCLDTGDCCSDYKQICDVQGKTFFLYTINIYFESGMSKLKSYHFYTL